MKFTISIFTGVLFTALSANAATIFPKAPTLSEGCYEISDARELYGFAAIVNGTDGYVKNISACGKLTKDIVVNDIEDLYDIDIDAVVQWNPLDTFAGTFDGNGHTISGLVRNVAQETEPQDVGFIRVLVANPEKPTVIKNLGVVKSAFVAKDLSSGVAMGIFAVSVIDSDLEDGEDSYAQIVNCFNQSMAYYKKDGERSYLVRNVGRHAILTIENSYNAGKGQLFGSSSDTVIVKNSYQLDSKESMDSDGVKHATESQFRNGAVAYVLHEANSIWGQDVETDDYPNFSGAIKNSKVDRYSVTFHTFTGDTATYFDSYISGFTYDLPDTVAKEKTLFLGWFKDKEFSGEPEALIAASTSGNLEYWAKLENFYEITFHLDNGRVLEDWYTNYDAMLSSRCEFWRGEETVSCKYVEGFHGNLPTGNIAFKEGYFLEGWYDNAELTGTRIDSMNVTDSGDKNFYAKWFKLKTPALDAADNCYEISDAAELYGFAQMVNGMDSLDRVGPHSDLCAKLTKDIVVNENVLKSDGTLDESGANKFLPWLQITQFWGTFDGQGHSISGLYMFGSLGMIDNVLSKADGTPSVIRNLTIVDSYSVGSGIVAYVGNLLIIDNCHFKGNINVKKNICYGNKCSLARLGGMGGLVGHSESNLVIKNSSFEGKMISREDAYMGGLVGSSYGKLTLIQNYSKGAAYLDDELIPDYVFIYAGSLVGHLLGNALIVNNYSVFDMNGVGKGLLGGLFGTDGSFFTVSKKERIEYKPLQSYILNNYNMGSFSSEYTFSKPADVWVVENAFYKAAEGIDVDGAQPVVASAFEDGSLAATLHDYVQKDWGVNGSVWKQGDYYPVFAQKDERYVATLHTDTTGSCTYLFYTPGEAIALPELKREGYTLDGWYTSPKFLSAELVTEIAATDFGYLDFYAEWSKITVTVRATAEDPDAGRVKVGNTWSNLSNPTAYETYDYGKTVYVQAIPYEGYRFVEWDNLCGTKSYCSFSATEKVNLVATFEVAPSSSSVASSSSVSSSSVASSSSAEPPKSSSSSAKSSSSVSSSSSVKSSSSSAKSSSSSAKSSSSSANSGKSSSSGKKDSFVHAAVPQFSVYVVNRDLQVAGAHVGDRYALFDMQGNVVLRGAVNSSNFNIAVPIPGNYVLRIGNGCHKVTVRF